VAKALKAILILVGSYGRLTNITEQLSLLQKYLRARFTRGFPHTGQATILITETQEKLLKSNYRGYFKPSNIVGIETLFSKTFQKRFLEK
jgi:hypothetical protein